MRKLLLALLICANPVHAKDAKDIIDEARDAQRLSNSIQTVKAAGGGGGLRSVGRFLYWEH